jgi:hypothetical protein
MRSKYIAAAVGVSAGLSAYLPSFVCPGAACTSCFGCVGAGGAALSAVLAGVITRRRTVRLPPTGRQASGDHAPCDATNHQPRGRRTELELPIEYTDLRRNI